MAASDRANTFTGFQGHETKIPVFESSRDDRPPENISYGATNLVQKNLAGRSRQQSEPPISRNAFPPTPPPDEKASSLAPSNGSTGSLTRKQSLTRATRPPVLELGRRASSEQTQSIGGSMAVDSQQPKAQQEKSRVGTVRTASEPRGPASRLSAIRYGPPTNGKLLFRETTGQHRRPMSNISPLSEEPQAYYTMYAAGPGPGYTTGKRPHPTSRIHQRRRLRIRAPRRRCRRMHPVRNGWQSPTPTPALQPPPAFFPPSGNQKDPR